MILYIIENYKIVVQVGKYITCGDKHVKICRECENLGY